MRGAYRTLANAHGRAVHHARRRMHAEVPRSGRARKPEELYFPRLVNVYRPPLISDPELATGPTESSSWLMRPAVIVGARVLFGAAPAVPDSEEKSEESLVGLMKGPKNGACGVRTFAMIGTSDEIHSLSYQYKDIALLAQKNLYPPSGVAPLGMQNPSLEFWSHEMPKNGVGDFAGAANFIEQIGKMGSKPHKKFNKEILNPSICSKKTIKIVQD